jgi:hypothetical protein
MKVYDGSAWTVTADGLSLGDNDKATFGAGNDLEIYHDGIHARLRETTGDFRIQTTSGGVNALVAKQNAEVEITYAGSTKLATTSTGIDVTGTATMDGLTVEASVKPIITLKGDGNDAINTNYGEIQFFNNDSSSDGPNIGASIHVESASSTGSGGNLFFSTEQLFAAGEGTLPLKRLQISHIGDISFYEDTGTTPKFFWDASAESLALGTSTSVSNNRLVIDQASGDGQNSGFYMQRNGGAGTSFKIDIDSDDVVNFRRSISTKIAINSSGNVGIGTSSPDSLLEVSGADESQIKVTGTSGVEAVLRASASTVTVGSNTAHNLYLRTSNSARMTITADGKVGIGTTSPDEALEVNGDVKISGASSGNAGVLHFGGVSDDVKIAGFDRNSSPTNSMLFYTNTAERMRIDSSGNVGIGTSSPASKIHVSGSGAQEIRLTRTGGGDRSYSTSIGGSLEYNIRDETAGVNRLSISTAGNVGIGTSSPTSELTINGGATSTDVRLQNTNSGSGAGNGLDIGLGSVGDNGYIYLYENGHLYFATNATERMRIDASGNLLVGNTAAGHDNI